MRRAGGRFCEDVIESSGRGLPAGGRSFAATHGAPHSEVAAEVRLTRRSSTEVKLPAVRNEQWSLDERMLRCTELTHLVLPFTEHKNRGEDTRET